MAVIHTHVYTGAVAVIYTHVYTGAVAVIHTHMSTTGSDIGLARRLAAIHIRVYTGKSWPFTVRRPDARVWYEVYTLT